MGIVSFRPLLFMFVFWDFSVIKVETMVSYDIDIDRIATLKYLHTLLLSKLFIKSESERGVASGFTGLGRMAFQV